MPSGTIIRVWQEHDEVFIAAKVNEATNTGNVDVEYIAAVPVSKLQGLTTAQQRAILIAAVKAVRDGQAVSNTTLPGFTGTIVL